MLRAGYDPKLGAGVIAASGTLGQIIPPSTILIFMGDMLSGINAQVQMSKGNFAPTPVSVGDLFVGAILPSAVLVGLYMLYMAGKAVFDPKSCPATPFQREEGGHGLGREITSAVRTSSPRRATATALTARTWPGSGRTRSAASTPTSNPR